MLASSRRNHKHVLDYDGEACTRHVIRLSLASTGIHNAVSMQSPMDLATQSPFYKPVKGSYTELDWTHMHCVTHFLLVVSNKQDARTAQRIPRDASLLSKYIRIEYCQGRFTKV